MSRAQIIAFAKTLVGSHYLWGSGGDMPEYDNGVYYAPSTVCMAPILDRHRLPLRVRRPVERGAAQEIWRLCLRRSLQAARRPHRLHRRSRVREIYGRPAGIRPSAKWEPYRGHCRRASRVGGNIGANNGRPVWGEDCRNKRHFDCDSFVNYVLSHTTKKSWGFTSQAVHDGVSAGLSGPRLICRPPPVDGDILLRVAAMSRCSALTIMSSRPNSMTPAFTPTRHTTREAGRRGCTRWTA